MLRIFPLNAEVAPLFLEPYLLTYSKKLSEFLYLNFLVFKKELIGQHYILKLNFVHYVAYKILQGVDSLKPPFSSRAYPHFIVK